MRDYTSRNFLMVIIEIVLISALCCCIAFCFAGGGDTDFLAYGAPSDVAYQVKHYWQNILDDSYTLIDTDQKTGEANQYTAATEKQYDGFAVVDSWNQTLIAADGSTVVEIYYNRLVYTVLWKDGDSLLETDQNLRHGSSVEFNSATPTKPSTAQYDYSFSGWSPTIAAVTGNITYNANFENTEKSYTVEWTSGGQLLTSESVVYGVVPTYDGEIPVKKNDENGKYVFNGWTPAVTAVTGNARFEAVFVARPFSVTGEQEGDVKSTINSSLGFDINSVLSVKTATPEAIAERLSIPEGKQLVQGYSAALYVGETLSALRGDTTVRIAKPDGLSDDESFSVIIIEGGKQVEKTATLEDGYIVFVTHALNDFAIITDAEEQIELTWLVILLACIVALELIGVCILLKRYFDEKKKPHKTRTYSVVALPLLAATVAVEDVVAVAVLGVLMLVLAVLLVCLAVKQKELRRKAEKEADDFKYFSSPIYVLSTSEQEGIFDDEEEKECLEDIVKQARKKAVVIDGVSKESIAECSESICASVTRRNSYDDSGFPLATDTHYLNVGKRRICIAFVYELIDEDEGKTFLLINVDRDTADEIKQEHPLIEKSVLPKSQHAQWYSLIVDDSFSQKEELFDVIKTVCARQKRRWIDAKESVKR